MIYVTTLHPLAHEVSRPTHQSFDAFWQRDPTAKNSAGRAFVVSLPAQYAPPGVPPAATP